MHDGGRDFLSATNAANLRELVEETQRAQGGRGRLVMLQGPSGCGKSFTLERFADILAAHPNGLAPKVVHDTFKIVEARESYRTTSLTDVAESVAKDLFDLSARWLPFRETIVKTLRVLGEHFGDSALQRWLRIIVDRTCVVCRT